MPAAMSGPPHTQYTTHALTSERTHSSEWWAQSSALFTCLSGEKEICFTALLCVSSVRAAKKVLLYRLGETERWEGVGGESVSCFKVSPLVCSWEETTFDASHSVWLLASAFLCFVPQIRDSPRDSYSFTVVKSFLSAHDVIEKKAAFLLTILLLERAFVDLI